MTKSRQIADAEDVGEIRNASQRRSWQRLRPRIATFVAVGWIVQIGALVTICLWIFFDGDFSALIHTAFARETISSTAAEDSFLGIGFAARVWNLRVLVAAAALSIVVAICGLAFGSRSQRRVTAWLALTAWLAGWLALVSTWSELAWQGQQWRMTRQIERFAPIAQSLQTHWPTDDGETPNLGSYMAYPREDPQMLMIIAQPNRPGRTAFVSVERSERGALRFELSGSESGAWLEWHPPGDKPLSFVGGLETDYLLERSAAIGEGWHVARYRVRGASGKLQSRTAADD